MPARIAGAHLRRATGILCLLAGVLLGACSSSGPSGGKPMSYISGAPPATATVGEPYSFQPSTSDAAGKRFTIVNRPPWAQFSETTGSLTGTPAAAHVGSYGDIRIAVEAGSTSASLAAFSIQVVPSRSAGGRRGGASPDAVTLSWVPPVENTDGSSLTNLAGYRVYSGETEHALELREEIDNPGVSSYVIDSPEASEIYFAIASVSSKGVESELSNVVYAGGD
jgi:hypothetical protein